MTIPELYHHNKVYVEASMFHYDPLRVIQQNISIAFAFCGSGYCYLPDVDALIYKNPPKSISNSFIFFQNSPLFSRLKYQYSRKLASISRVNNNPLIFFHIWLLHCTFTIFHDLPQYIFNFNLLAFPYLEF